MTANQLPQLLARLEALARKQVLVGFPEGDQKSMRQEEPGLTNASIAYIQDRGAPEANIPARPFMIPGVEAAAEQISSRMFAVARKAAKPDGDVVEVEDGLSRAGIAAVSAIRKRINEGIPPPLSDRTVAARAARGRKGAMWEMAWRAAGAPPGVDLAKPLVDTGQLRNAVTYVIRSKKGI